MICQITEIDGGSSRLVEHGTQDPIGSILSIGSTNHDGMTGTRRLQ